MSDGAITQPKIVSAVSRLDLYTASVRGGAADSSHTSGAQCCGYGCIDAEDGAVPGEFGLVPCCLLAD